MIAHLLIAATILFCAGLLVAERRDDARLRAMFKTSASLAFVGAGYFGGALQSSMGTALFVGLFLSAVGDVLLLSRGERRLLAGIAAFALGHVAYCAAFVAGGVHFGPAAAIAAGVTLGSSLIFLGPLRSAMGAMAWPVAIYVLIISSMVGLSVGHHDAAPSVRSLMLVTGAAAFAASDISVAQDRFGVRRFANRAWGLPLYYGAQLLIAAAV